MKNIFLLSAFAVLLPMLSGCWTTPGGISASTTQLNPQDTYTIVKRDVSGRDSALLFLTFPISHPDTEAALKDALSKTMADALINVTVDTSYLSFILFTFEHTIIHGDAIKIKRSGKLIN